MTRRKEIEKFCRDFLRGNGHQQLYELIGNYEFAFSQIDIQQFTRYTLDCSFRRICSKVFTRRPVSNGYIIAVLGFSAAIHAHYSTFSWYTIDILMCSLVNVLEETDFNPKELTGYPNFCILL